MKPSVNSVSGFSLVELVIVTVLVGIMAMMLTPMVTTVIREGHETKDDAAVLDKLRYATERLVREIRSVKFANPAVQTSCANVPTPANAKYCISNMSANSLSFRRSYLADLSDERNVTIGTSTTVSSACANPPCVTIGYSDIANGAAQILMDDLGQVSNLAFSYFQSDGSTAATSNENVSFIQISLTLNHNGTNYTQRTRVELRAN